MLELGSLFFILAFGSSFKNQQTWVFASLLILTALIGFRELSVGDDSYSYYNMYNGAGAHGYQGYPEILYGYTEVLFCKLGFTFWQFQFTLFAIGFYAIWKAIKQWSPNQSFSVFVFYGLYLAMYAMNATRQIFAVSLLLWGYSYLAQNKYIKFSALVALACGFHTSCVLAYSALLIPKFHYKSRSKIIFIVLLSLIIGLIMPVEYLVTLSGNYGHYLNTVDSNGLRTESRLIQALFLSIFWSTLLIICLNYMKDIIKQNFWVKLYIVAIIVNNLCMRTEQGLRIVWIFSIAEIIALPLIIQNSKIISSTLMKLIVVVFLTIFFFTLLGTNSASVLPYYNRLLTNAPYFQLL